MRLTRFDDIIATGNRGHRMVDNNWIECVDGFRLSVLAGGGTYCTPRPVFCSCHFDLGFEPLEPGLFWPHEVVHDYPGPYTHVEVGFPSEIPEPWTQWEQWAEKESDPTDSVYGQVPMEAVAALIALHGGEKSS